MPKFNAKKKKELLSEEVRTELDGMDATTLRKAIADSEQNIATAKRELDANEHYQKAKADLRDLSGGFRDVRKYQGAKIAYCLAKLEGMTE